MDSQAFTGEFSSEEGVSPFKVDVNRGQLQIRRRKFKPDELSPIVRDVFRTEIGFVRFLRGADGRVIALDWTTERTRRMHFKRTG